ncbi:MULTISPECIES: thioredoxin fold domain-containing protein [unclassified Thioalkalivibrio]|uniref:thioredoxin family protein n=1 Tax=unclassified Thioalkalivibrio TaxID=2621013 RepID=UPI00036732CD|nr:MULTISPECIES: thioredoxin fold domain-containing protein [unclassified Thioalkalivibrio]
MDEFMMTRNRILAAFGLAAAMLFAGPAQAELERVTDLQALKDNGERKPTVVMFTAENCPYCELAKEAHLGPMSRDEAHSDVNILMVEMNGEEVRDFDGNTMRGSELGNRYGARVTPTLVAFDAEGNPVGRPLVGIPNEELYRSQVRMRINAAREGS